MQPTILIVDDDPAQLAAIARVLRRSRYEVVTARSGRIGLRMAVKSPPALILLDISMPTMSGHEFLRRLRRLEAAGRLAKQPGDNCPGRMDIPVIFVTALAAPRQRVDGLDAGAVDYIVKPFHPDELRARVRRQLRLAARQHQALSTLQAELRHAAPRRRRRR
ncbi:MAG: response regulator [Phycisphaerae bacterium]|jgi:DNA-binding response OmpR family regulator